MHYRRMHPQPHIAAKFRPSFGSAFLVGFYDLAKIAYVSETFYFEYPSVIHVPEDMRGATPWQDRNDEWYWRLLPRHSEGT